jgi:hypothetical protein
MRRIDNILIERLWRSLKTEEIYLKDYGNVPDLSARAIACAAGHPWNATRPPTSSEQRKPGGTILKRSGPSGTDRKNRVEAAQGGRPPKSSSAGAPKSRFAGGKEGGLLRAGFRGRAVRESSLESTRKTNQNNKNPP